jgi:hypothetical protein
MFDFLRNLTKTEAEKQQERVSAYLDDALTPDESAAFEEQLAADTALRASLEQQRMVKQDISQLPRLHAPRNFTLDPAVYGRPAPQPAFKLYPVMRAATALAAVMLIFLFSLEIFSPSANQSQTAAESPITLSNAAREDAIEEAADTVGDAADEGAAPAPEAGIFSESLAEGESVEEALESEEEAFEEEAMQEEPAAEDADAETAGEVAAAVEEEMAVDPPQPAEPTPAVGAAGGDNPPPVAATEQPLTVTQESETEITGGDGYSIAQGQEPSTTLGIVTTIPTATLDRGLNTEFFSTTTVVPATQFGLDDDTAESPLRLLQIGAGILFLILLTATWLIRRRL